MALAVTATLELTAEEYSLLQQKFGTNCLSSRVINVKKNYSNELIWDFQVAEEPYLKLILSKKEIPSDMLSLLNLCKSFTECLAEARKISEPPKGLSSLITQLEMLELRTMSDEMIDGYFDQWLPKFYYMNELPLIANNFSLKHITKGMYTENLKNKIDPSLFFFKLIQADIDEIIYNPDTQETQKLLSTLSEKLHPLYGKMIKEYSDTRLRFSIKHIQEEGANVDANLSIKVSNDRSPKETPLEEKSQAFVRLLSLLSTFSGVEEKSKSAVILMEDPGIWGSIEFQKQLIELLYETGKNRFQILYITQSPGMIHTKRRDSIYKIKFSPSVGTVVTQNLDEEGEMTLLWNLALLVDKYLERLAEKSLFN